ncbi:hypothetical protein AVEN_235139-1 [Araneus ventricosus]|uniref:CCHC-type domain-containing protein n=1 Tax=Araneus ventricosus TaxID=182803 RepID=A0A4Y2VDI1_ARAVE|nr:hypothetical protein AVEN_235139-1 [Araneus ventricosus]
MQALNTRVDEVQKFRKSLPPERQNKNQVTCFHCNKQGHYANECRKKLAERRKKGTRNSGRYSYGRGAYDNNNTQRRNPNYFRAAAVLDYLPPWNPTMIQRIKFQTFPPVLYPLSL